MENMGLLRRPFGRSLVARSLPYGEAAGRESYGLPGWGEVPREGGGF